MTIEGIFSCQAGSQPMQSKQAGRLIVNKGLEGDRYCNQLGTYSVFRSSKLCPGEREPGRQLTLLSADSVEEAFAREDLPALKNWGSLRRNIVLRGVSAEQLSSAIGSVVQLGTTAKVLVHRHTVPCMYNERKNSRPGLMEAIWNESGVSAQVIEGGEIRLGDDVTILADEKGDVDDGIQNPGYYVPPSKRTATMVKDSLAMRREQKKQLQATDPEGVARATKSYGSVDLTFWPRDTE